MFALLMTAHDGSTFAPDCVVMFFMLLSVYSVVTQCLLSQGCSVEHVSCWLW